MANGDLNDADNSSTSTSSNPSSSSYTPSKPRHRPPPLPLDSLGVEPNVLVGKVLTKVHRSPTHPNITLDFADNTSYQILVDGYSPRYRGVPKTLETDAALQPLFDPPQGHASVDLLVTDCTIIRMSDRAFERKDGEQRWDQDHSAVAFKFGGENRWHCVWATLEEFDGQLCTFRSFDDVYLEPLVRTPRSPQKGSWRKRGGRRTDGRPE